MCAADARMHRFLTALLLGGKDGAACWGHPVLWVLWVLWMHTVVPGEGVWGMLSSH